MANLLLAEPAQISLISANVASWFKYWERFRDAVVYDHMQANGIKFLECGERVGRKGQSGDLNIFET